jgi:hypothetical protein
MPPAYGRQNSRSLTVTGAGEIQTLRISAAAAGPATPVASFAKASAAMTRTEALCGSSTSDASSSPSSSCTTGQQLLGFKADVHVSSSAHVFKLTLEVRYMSAMHSVPASQHQKRHAFLMLCRVCY